MAAKRLFYLRYLLSMANQKFQKYLDIQKSHNTNYEKSLNDFEEALKELNDFKKSIKIDFLKNSSIAIGNHKSASTMLQNFLERYSYMIARDYFGNELKEYNKNLKDSKFFQTPNDNLGYLQSFLHHDFNNEIVRFFGDYSYAYDFTILDKISNFILKTKPCLFFGFRGPVIKNFLKYKSHFKKFNIICLIRDPRDVIVSSYFSYYFTHVENKNSYLKEITKNVIPDLNTYTLEEGITPAFEELGLVSSFLQPNLTVYKYEDFWFNKKDFCLDLIERINFPLDEKLFSLAFNDLVEPSTAVEGIVKSGHLRNGNPGEYKQKLSKDTINFINEKYKPILELYNYS